MFSVDTQTLQAELLDLLILLRNLNPTHLLSICRFAHHNPDDLMIKDLLEVLQSASPNQVDKMIAATVKNPPLPQLLEDQDHDEDEFVDKLPKDLIESFSILLELFQLQKLLNGMSILQLMKLFEAIPPNHPQQQLQILEQLQQLLGQLLPQTLLSLHEELKVAHAGTEQQLLAQLLQLKKENFHLYQPLRVLLTLEVDDLLNLQDIFPKLQPVQMRQLLEVLQLVPYDVLELKRLMQSKVLETTTTTSVTTEITTSSNAPSSTSSSQTQKRLHLKIVEQPPEKSVYKRNLKPNPMIQLVGDEDNKEPNLYVAPILLRCDTLEEKPKLMTGHKPIKVAPGRVVVFRRLKITSTSHQQGESLFAIKFELRRYHSNDEYEVLDYVQSNPICVLSHSTQLKPASSTTATISEVIPYSGSSTGGTRVAVLGNNFVDTPSARVRFDNTDVMPIFHGPRTLICSTPEHKPGIVSVRVSNDSKVWSPTAASFTYEEKKVNEDVPESNQVTHSFDLGLDIASSICEAAWQGGYETVKELSENQHADINMNDGNNYSALHYSTSNGFVDITSYLLDRGADADIEDGTGCTPLHWAVYWGHRQIAKMLVEHGANVNVCNDEGISPIQVAAVAGDSRMVSYLLKSGAKANVSNFDGESALHCAIALNQKEVVKTLITRGAHLNMKDLEGDAPLHTAVRAGDLDIVEMLCKKGADVRAINEDLETPLHLAASQGDIEIVKVLLKHSADPNAKDFGGYSPLIEAAVARHENVVNVLLENGAQLDLQQKFSDDVWGTLSKICSIRDLVKAKSAPLGIQLPAISPLTEHPFKDTSFFVGDVTRMNFLSLMKQSESDNKQHQVCNFGLPLSSACFTMNSKTFGGLGTVQRLFEDMSLSEFQAVYVDSGN